MNVQDESTAGEDDDEQGGENNAMTMVGSVDHSVVEARPVALLVSFAALIDIGLSEHGPGASDPAGRHLRPMSLGP